MVQRCLQEYDGKTNRLVDFLFFSFDFIYLFIYIIYARERDGFKPVIRASLQKNLNFVIEKSHLRRKRRIKALHTFCPILFHQQVDSIEHRSEVEAPVNKLMLQLLNPSRLK
jgi:hypothetical protein